jgi:hypothetical protein
MSSASSPSSPRRAVTGGVDATRNRRSIEADELGEGYRSGMPDDAPAGKLIPFTRRKPRPPASAPATSAQLERQVAFGKTWGPIGRRIKEQLREEDERR